MIKFLYLIILWVVFLFIAPFFFVKRLVKNNDYDEPIKKYIVFCSIILSPVIMIIITLKIII